MGVCNVSLIIFDKISTNIFDRKWMWDTQRMSYIYFVSKMFFYDKMDLKKVVFFRGGGWGFFESIFNKIIIMIMCFTS